jgi:acyl-CoA synthetase (AMP-forming)/AMP-acid ligase II
MELRQDISGFRVRLDEATIAAHTQSGAWRNRSLGDYARELAREDPDAILLIDNGLPITRGTMLDKAQRFGAALRNFGLKSGDVISFQLPNWHEAAVVHLAAALEGFVSNPIVPIYRDAELSFILSETRSRIFVCPAIFRGFDYRMMARRLAASLTAPPHIMVVRGECEEFESFDSLCQAEPHDPQAIDPNAVKTIMYTSGTTGPAKGVLHTHNSTMAEIDQYALKWALGPGDSIFMASPLCHITGLNWAVETPWVLGCSAVLAERWDPAQAIQTMREHRCTVTAGATVFLRETIEAAQAANEALPDLRLYLCGGASIPPQLVRRAQQVLPHTLTARVYGSTELPTVTYGVLMDKADLDHAAETDGLICNWDVKLCDPVSGVTLTSGEGEIACKGPEMFVGYSRVDDTTAAFDDEGYFRTGDIGTIVDERYIVVTDRKKDLIIRGGENISSKEVEDALAGMPGLGPVAIVAMPSARMGEAVCAVVEAATGAPSVAEMAAHLQKAGLSRQKFPEMVVAVDRLPMTAGGKVRKDMLRRLVAQRVSANPPE